VRSSFQRCLWQKISNVNSATFLPSLFGLSSATLALFFFFVGLFLSRRERHYTTSVTPINSSVEFFVPGSEVSLEEISSWQLYNPDLREVIVICDEIEAPISVLHTAVIANFQSCVVHKFFVSPKDYQERHQDNFGYFHTLYEIAQDRPEIEGATKTITRSVSFRDLFQIQALSEPWAKAPYIFYRCETANGTVTRALRGNIVGSGIAFRYRVVEPEDAHAIVTTVLRLSHGRTKVEVTMEELQNTSATVLPFPTNKVSA
jgi:hypothetical protein